MKDRTKVVLAVVGTLALAGGAGAQTTEPAATEQQVRQQTEQQIENAGQAEKLRTQQQTEQAIRQGAGEPSGAGAQAQQRQRIYGEQLMTVQERARQQGKKLGKDGSVLTGDQLRDRDKDMDRDRIHQMDQLSRPQTAPTPGPGRGGGGRGGG